MYATKDQWIMLIVCGIITVVGYNFGLAIRDIRSIPQEPQIPQSQYKQIPVIPFTNSTS